MKSVLVDIYKTKNLYSGLGQFSLNFHRELCKQAPKDWDLSFLYPNNFESEKDNSASYIPVSTTKRYFPFLNPKFNIWHSLHQFPSHLPNKSTHFILTIHDLNFLTEKDQDKSKAYLNKLQKNVDRANTITVISDFTKKVVLENLELNGKKVHTIHNGVTLKPYTDPDQPDFMDHHPFFFSIGILSAKKNFHVLLPLLKRFTEHRLVIAGKKNTAYGMELIRQIKAEGLESKVIMAGEVSDKDKFWLYRNCEAFLFPSLAEGFGLPVVEAMLAGKPVFLSRSTSLPEIGGPLANYWDNFDSDDIISVLDKGLKNHYMNKEQNAEKLKQHALQFSWERSMKQYIELYTAILNNQ